MERGNEPASVNVRWHATLGALLLLAAALGALLALAVSAEALVAAILALLGGLTLLLGAALLWYLPSFAKRKLRWRPLAQAAPWILAVGVVALLLVALLDGDELPSGVRFALLRAGVAGLALGVVALHAPLLAGGLAGAPWRGGVGFWRADTPHRASDRVAAALLLAGLVVGLAAAAVGLYAIAGRRGDAPVALAAWGWAASLAILAAGALAHLVPRARGQPASPWPTALGAGLFAAAVLAAPLAVVRHGGALPRIALAVGVLLLVVGLHGHAPHGKRAGPRMREARWQLVAAPAAAFAGAVGLFEVPRDAGLDLVLAILAATLLAVGALCILALPVVFNQRPAARWLPAAALLPLAAAFLARLSVALDRWEEPLFLLGVVAFAAAPAALVAALWPLRSPRRACPPDA